MSVPGLLRRGASIALAASLAGATWAPSFAAGARAGVRVGKYTSARRAFSTNSFWVEGDEGLVLIDTQFLPSDAVKFAETAQRETGKPVKLAVVLHPNPDKFNGVASLQARGIRVVTSRQVSEIIAPIHAVRMAWYEDDFKPDYPRDTPKPEVFGERTTELSAAGLKLKLHVLGGPGCSNAHVVAQVDDDLFVGDLIAPKGHAWLEFALFNDWLKRLDELAALKPVRIHVGRGESGDASLIDAQRRYLQTVRTLVQEAQPEGELGMLQRWRLKSKITAAFPDYDWDAFVWESLPAVWRKLAVR